MPLTRLDNLISSKTGKYLYVSPDDYNASDALDNRGNTPLRPFVSIQRAFLEVARFSYLPNVDNDRFDQFTIMLAPGTHYIDNRPGIPNVEDVPVFQFNEALQQWETNANVSFDLSDADNILYKFNGRDGGATIPRGTSLVGTDLRRTQLRPLYVPDPADKDVPRCALFNVTGGCYFWQFTILDGDLSSNSPLYDGTVGRVYTQPNDNTNKPVPEFSHHKITNFVFADREDLGLLYRKIARAFGDYQPNIDDVYVEGSSQAVSNQWSATTTYNAGDRVIYSGNAFVASAVVTGTNPESDETKWTRLVIRGREFDYRVQENRIVGPLSDAVFIDSIKLIDGTGTDTGILTLEIRTKINHGFFPGQYVAVTNNNLNTALNGVFSVYNISTNDPKVFYYRVPFTAQGLNLTSDETYTATSTISLNQTVTVQAEVDSVESASPYVFNVSIRSTWGICGIWADGRKATGFKSMVIAQYTGVSLQRDDRAFIRYDEFSNTWNQAPLTDAFATTPYHIKGDAYWKDDWRNFHVRASDDSFIQNVSIFAVGFADHFLLESGGDMSITNSNSNFGNTSMHSKGFKGFSFNQDKGGYITDIIPPQELKTANKTKQQYYPININLTNDATNQTKIYLGGDSVKDPENRPAGSVSGFRLGAKVNEEIKVKLNAGIGESGPTEKSAVLKPSGFKIWSSSLTTLNPAGASFTTEYNLRQDAANIIESNRSFIQSEAFGYILEKYPSLQNISYVNPNITVDTGRYRDASNLIRANRQEIIDTAYSQLVTAFPGFVNPNEIKCRRDLGYVVDAIANDLYDGGNAYTVEATKSYFNSSGQLLTNGLSGEQNQSVYAFDKVRDLSKLAITNQLTVKDLTITADPATGSNVSVNSCANVKSTIDTLSAILTVAISSGSLASVPVPNPGLWSRVSENSKCKRDIGYIVEAIVADLRLGGNINTVNAAKAYYVGVTQDTDGVNDGFTLDYIQDELSETLDAYTYVRDLCISAMRNHNTYVTVTTQNSSIVTVPSTRGLVVGMKVLGVNIIPSTTGNSTGNELTNFNDQYEEIIDGKVVPKSSNISVANIPAGSYIKRIVNSTQIELGVQGSKLNIGTTKTAVAGTGVKVFFQLESGVWTSSIGPSVDNTVIQDYNYSGDGECASIYSALNTYFSIISTILQNGVNSVTATSPDIDTALLSQRATAFTLQEIVGQNLLANPHDLETGTPVKLVPRARPGSDVDKRLVRLPRGFSTNTKYYVIAPGRRTQPFNYATGDFGASDQQKILLASSEENAAAGIYIYSSETENVNEDVIIDVYQYVLDNSYDLHQYKTTLFDSTTFLTESPHIFDVPVNDAGVTLQKVFFRTGSDLGANSALPNPANTYIGLFNDTTEYYVRYFDDASGSNIAKKFKIFLTAQNAILNENPVEFFENSGTTFYTFANKKRSPMKFNPTVDTASTPKGRWYLDTVADITSKNIITRMKQSDYSDDSVGPNAKTSDAYFERTTDARKKEDRVYRFRFVIPAYRGTTVRDPLNGFVFKVRTDSKRKLLAQKILLKPTGNASPFATFYALNSANQQVGEKLGWTYSQLNAAGFDDTVYDPYLNPVTIQTNSKITANIQSARQRTINGVDYLELTVFDHDVDPAYKTTIFTTVKITSPQGGDGTFEASLTDLDSDNYITWDGACSGSGYVHAYLNYENEYYIILKGITGNSTLDFDAFSITTFTQGSVNAVMMDEPDGGRTKKEVNLYAIEGANVYTLTPGDIVKDSTNVSYTIAEVTDIEDLEGSYYIFSVDTIRRRIPNQQDGVYYLTCVRGDTRPYPVGSGVGENFRNFKFSQPISKLYPEFYKNDPEWYRALDDTLKDPPATTSAADNYIHGLVTVNDSKNSLTKETVLDFVQDSGSGSYSFTGGNEIQAQSGPASAGSETRKIPISGDSVYPTEKRLYVELRRPSIARSGNHTFEYLGFGPGNYSTGFPARQEIVLTDVQDFYAQAKREDAGIVFYTGLNSNGDLYIGNRKINAITGEETFLESAELVESEDDDEDVGTLVTTFEVPVTFKDIITVEGFDGTEVSTFTSPVYFNVRVLDDFGGPVDSAITVKTNIDPNNDDGYLLNTSLGQKTGDIEIEKNSIALAMLRFYARGEQGYTFRAHISNKTPDQASPFGGDISQPSTQIIKFGSRNPISGDVLLKGSQTDVTGGAGWIFANTYSVVTKTGDSGITNPQIASIQGFGSGNVIRLNWNTLGSPAWTNSLLGITESTQIKIVGAQSPIAQINGIWRVVNTIANPFSPTLTYLDVSPSEGQQITVESNTYSISNVTQPNITISRSSSSWREWGIIGTEALRTETSNIGDYKLGINTVSRSSHSAYNNAFISSETEPRANLDLVGTAFFSGKTLTTSPNNYLANSNPVNRTFNGVSNAFLIGGDSATPNNEATFRLSTSTNRVGINITNAELDRTLVVDGNGRITGNFRFESDVEVNGGDITTTVTSGTFNFVNDTTFTGTLNIGNWASTVNFVARATTLNIANTTTSTQTINVGNAAVNQTVNIGTTGTGTHDVNIATAATSTTTLDVFNASANVRVDIGNPSVSATSSKITLGGAYNANESNSFLEVKTKSAKFFGDIQIGSNKSITDTVVLGTSAGSVNFFSTSGAASTISFGLNASELNIGGQGGTTTIRNSLTVDASVLSKGNITLDGGTATFSFNGTRAQLGSAIASHTGFPNNAPLDKNIDLVSVVSGFNNAVDTAGAGPWGGSFFQNAIGTYTANSGAALVALTGNQFYLPLASSPTYAEGDDILIDSTIATGVHPEIVKVAPGGLVRTTASPYYIIVERQPYGTFLPQKTTHPDDTITRKVNVALDATWLTANTDGAGTSDVFNLAEFGGTLANGDYIFVDRNTTGTTGEAVKIASSVGATAQKLIVTNGAGATKFEVNSVTGATIVSDAVSLGGLTVYGPLNFVGSCVSTTENRKFKLSNTTGETFSVDMCNGETTITQGTLTTDVKALDATATWNSAATTFTGIKLNVTNTASNDASKLIDLQIGGTTRFNVDASSGDTYLRGDLTVNGNDIKSSTNTALTLSGSDVTVVGDLTVTGNDIKSSTGATVLTLSANDATFADKLTVTGDLTVNGGDFAVNSGGTERFNVNSNGAIDLGGITQYFTPTGGRKWIYIPTQSNTQTSAILLSSNTNYYVIPSGSGSNLILTLPSSPSNGDMIRILDLGGQITYNTQLIIRATNSKSIQGDTTGSTFGMSSGSYTGGGELIINTPNVGLGLVYVGDVDGIGTAIPSNVQGWRLTEI